MVRRYRRIARRVGRFARRGARAAWKVGKWSYNNRHSAAWMASKALRGVNYMRGMINCEKHFLDTTVSTACSDSPVVSHLSAIGVGDDYYQRTGNSILAKRLDIRVTMTLNASATSDVIRLVVVRDEQQVADTAPTMTSVFTSSNPDTYINPVSAGRYSILYDKIHVIDNAKSLSKFVKIPISLGTHIRYNGTATTDINKGGIYLMYVGTHPTNTTTFRAQSRLAFYDN